MLQAASLLKRGYSCCDWKHVQYTVTSLLPYFCVACLSFLPLSWHFLYLIADVPALPFAKGLKGFHISLCFHALPLLIYLTLCIFDSRTMWGPAMSLGVWHLCCYPLVYTHPSIGTPLHFCSLRFRFIDHLHLSKACFVSKGDFI